jgi:hypothetical protein
VAATPTFTLEGQRNDVQLLTKEFEAGRLSETLYLEAVSARLDLVGEKVTNTKGLAEDLGLTFTSAFENAIIGGQSFSDVLKGVEQDILRIITRKAVTEPLGNAISGAMSGFNFASLLGFDGGGYTGAGSRTGGMDGKGGFVAMLHPQETVIDHTKGQRAGGNTVVVNQSFVVGDVASTGMVKRAIANSQKELIAAVVRQEKYS